MAFVPIARAPIQYEKLDGNPANDYYIKFYAANSSAPIPMATDATGATQIAKAKLNERGFPISNPLDDGTIFIPHLSTDYDKYRFVLYASANDADTNNVTDGLPNIQSVGQVYDLSTILSGTIKVVDDYSDFSTLGGQIGDVAYLLGIGGGIFDAVSSSGLTSNTGTISISGSIAWVRRFYGGATPGMYGAMLDGVTNDSAATQAALNNHDTICGDDRDSVVNGLIVPASNRKITGPMKLFASANNVTVMTVQNDTSRHHAKTIEGIEISGNGKSGVIGLRYGATTNNPTAGAKEAILYCSTNDVTVKDCDTGFYHDVTMEHTANNMIALRNTVGMKLYGDATNGGANANTFVGYRANSNQVGLMIASRANLPVQNNLVVGGTFQENTLCGLYLRGFGIGGPAVAQTLDNCHFEGNAVGATASAVVDGFTVLRSDIHIDNYASLTIRDCDGSSNANPFCVVRNNSTLFAHNFDGYGQQMGVVYDVDSTSKVFESGYCVATGIKYVESYGVFKTPGPGVCTTIGAPILDIGNYPNNSPLANSIVPEITNAIGVTVGSANDSVYGEVSTVQFSATTGSPSSNKFHWYGGAGTSGDMFIMSFLVKSSVNASFSFNSWRDLSYMDVITSLTAGKWRRIVVVGRLNSATGLQMFVFPRDNVGATLSFKAFQYVTTTDLGLINNIYSKGWVGGAYLSGSKTYDPPSISSGSQNSTTVSVSGAQVGDFVTATFSLDLQGMTLSGYVSASGTVTAVFKNSTGGSVDLGSGILRIRIARS